MTVPLSPQERLRLTRLLGMLGSNHDGEVTNAGRLADRLVRAAGLTWSDVLAPQVEYRQSKSDYWADEPPPAQTAWQKTVEACLECPARLTPWEANFLRDIRHRRRLTPRQHEVLDNIADKVRAAHHQNERRG